MLLREQQAALDAKHAALEARLVEQNKAQLRERIAPFANADAGNGLGIHRFEVLDVIDAAWSGEPQSRIPGQTARFGTVVRQVRSGYVVDGTKVFATSARSARWAILLVNTHGPGGARHSSAADGLLLLACDLADPSVRFDAFWV